jgi:hypothetical protein
VQAATAHGTDVAAVMEHASASCLRRRGLTTQTWTR